MAKQRKGIRVISSFLLLYMLLGTALPLAVQASSPTGNVPKVSIPQVSVPPVSNPPVSNPPVSNPPVSNPPVSNPPVSVQSVKLPEVSREHPELHTVQPSVPALETANVPGSRTGLISTSKASSLGAKDLFKKITRMTLGGREVIYKAAIGMDTAGKFKQGGWNTARRFAVKTISPWIDMVSFDTLHVYLDAEGLVGQGKNIKQSYDAYKAIKDSSTAPAVMSTAGGAARAGAGRLVGASFPVLGGIVGIITGTMDIIDSFSTHESTATADTVQFYSGVASVVGGIGSISSGAAIIAAGTAIAPALALAGTVLLAAGLIFGAAAVGLKYSAAFRNSPIGRRLSGIKNWLGARL